jgi:lipopolysaccharide export LptBFGC system permease protein LptF
MKRSPTVAAGLIICTLLGVLDIAGMAAPGMANACLPLSSWLAAPWALSRWP